MMVFGMFFIICACVFACMSGFMVDKNGDDWIPLGLSALVCAIFGSLVLGGIV